ncbi:cation transporting ATPase C-terminal domain-containing protein [Limosilactobacillus fermentum]
MLKAFTWYGLLSSLLCVAGFFFANAINGHAFPALATSGFDYRQATTMTLAVIIFCEIAAVLNIRDRNPIWSSHPPLLRQLNDLSRDHL